MSQSPDEYAGAVQEIDEKGDAVENASGSDKQNQPNPWHRDYTAKYVS